MVDDANPIFGIPMCSICYLKSYVWESWFTNLLRTETRDGGCQSYIWYSYVQYSYVWEGWLNNLLKTDLDI